MPFFSAAQDTDVWSLLSLLIISTVSGFISIAQRIRRGAAVTTLWVASEFLASLLLGTLVFDSFPVLRDHLPTWITLPTAVAAASFFGGRGLQFMEEIVMTKWPILDRRKPRSR